MSILNNTPIPDDDDDDDDDDEDDDDDDDDDNKPGPTWTVGVLLGVRDVKTYNRGRPS
jgi:hypothetical protein